MANENTEELVSLLSQLATANSYNRIDAYRPYPFQKEFHAAKDFNGDLAEQKALMAANQIGKTFCAAAEVTYHATGEYPDWWEGKRFKRPVKVLVAGVSNETVRDICQNELFGDPFEENSLGTGSIPRDKIGKATRKMGVPMAFSAVMIKHISGGWSKIRLMAYEQGSKAFMGVKFDVCWGDEEPPQDVWTQMLRATFSRKNYIILLTFTPESGVTELIADFMNNIKAGQSLVRAAWEDAPHMTEEKIKAYLNQLPVHERDMRSKGIPLMGSGLVFPISDERIICDPIPIPDHWPRICGVDFGIAHPFAAVWIAFDRDSGTSYVYDTYRESGQLPPIHASSIKKRDAWMPIAWPHDGINTDKGSGVPLADLYRAEGLNFLTEKFSNPPSPGQMEGKGGNGVEVGLFNIHTAMEEGRFKVFSNQVDWFEEKNMYHRKTMAGGKSKIVDLREDLMSATRYAYQSQRFARTRPVPKRRNSNRQRHTNW